MTRILLGADIVPTETNYKKFAEADKLFLLGDKLVDIFQKVDYRIFNLEVPLIDKKNPIFKSGPNLIAPENTIAGIKDMGIDLLGLANNHILDQGISGLENTIDILEKNGIAYVGAGENLKEAAQPFITKVNGIKIGIYACAEHEFTIADMTTPGANPFDLLESFEHVERLRKKVDYLIVMYHGGKEHYRYPSPNVQKYCRKFVDKGADLVVCQHTHCIGCEEKYNSGTIVYGQGNFLFDNSNREYWQTSLLILIEIIEDRSEIRYLPIRKHREMIRLAEKEDKEEILNDFYKRSVEIQSDEFIEKNYGEFAEKLYINYIRQCLGKRSHSICFRIFNKLSHGKLANGQFSLQDLLNLQNTIRCEAHSEVFLRGLEDEIKRRKG